MNILLNYWLLFTSRGFAVEFPPCFLSSITCPAPTYLPVHLFRSFLTFSTPPRPNRQSERRAVGWSERGGGRMEENLRRRQCQHACIRAYVHLTCVPGCILHMIYAFCLFVQTVSPPVWLPKLFPCVCRTCPHLCMAIKRKHSYFLALKPLTLI